MRIRDQKIVFYCKIHKHSNHSKLRKYGLIDFFPTCKKGGVCTVFKNHSKSLISFLKLIFQIIIHMIFKLKILCILIIMRQFWEFSNIVDYYGIFYLAERKKRLMNNSYFAKLEKLIFSCKTENLNFRAKMQKKTEKTTNKKKKKEKIRKKNQKKKFKD